MTLFPIATFEIFERNLNIFIFLRVDTHDNTILKVLRGSRGAGAQT